MNEQIRSLLPAILLIGALVILTTAAFVLLNSIPAVAEPVDYKQEAIAAQIIPTQTPLPFITPTETETLRPKWTLQPSETPTVTPTPTSTATPTRERVPTLTPARPYKFNERYELLPITADLMNQIARTVADYPDAMFPNPEGRFSEAYQAAFIYPAIIYQEALLRFPNAGQAEAWTWGLAYNLARLEDPLAVALYQDLLLEALSQPDLQIGKLPEWFHQRSPDLSLKIHELNLPGSQGAYKLLEIVEGHMVFLLAQQTGRAPALYPLTEGFDFNAGHGIAFTTLDMRGDSRPELALYVPKKNALTTLAAPHLFSLDAMPPSELPIQESLLVDFKIDTHVTLAANNLAGSREVLQAQAEIFPPCPVVASRVYEWDGMQAIPSDLIYTHEPNQANLAYCEPVLELAESFWDPAARVAIEEALLPVWPPETDPQGRPFPGDTKDKLRFNHAVNLALMGETQASIAALQLLINEPVEANSQWSSAAESFLESLADGSGLYLACQGAPICDLHAALRTIIRDSESTNPKQALSDLRKAGVNARSAGEFDFDLDGEMESWVTLRHQANEMLELWVLAAIPGGMRAVYVDQVEVDDPAPYWSDPVAYPQVFQFETRLGYRLKRIEGSQLPYLEAVDVEPVLSTYTRDVVIQAEKDLLNGKDPLQVRDNLLLLHDSGRFNCINHRVCDRYLYGLGLAAELSGDESLSIDTYIALWWENSTSPLAAAGRLKLLFIPATSVPSATARFTSTSTNTSSETPTPTANQTTPTLTPTP